MCDNNCIQLCTYNVNGLGNYKKRKDVFDYHRTENASVYILQETHLKTKAENMVRAMWGYDCILNGNNTNSNGVAVLFKNNFDFSFDFRLHTVIRDDEGKYIILDIEMLEKRMTLVNLYAPSSGDHPEFFEKIEKDIDKIANNYILIGGDWNVVLNPALDSSRYRAVNRPKARKKVYDLMLKYDLIDSWRELYPEKKKKHVETL